MKFNEIFVIGTVRTIWNLYMLKVLMAVSNYYNELKGIADYVIKQPHGNGVKEVVERYIPEIQQ